MLLTLARLCSDGVRNINTYHPDSLDKKILVHLKYFKTIEEIPYRVPESMMAQAKSKARIKMANVMIGTTLVCACITIYFAKTFSRQNSLVEENNVHRGEIEQLRREEEAMCDCVGVFLRAMVKDTSIPDHEMRVYGVDDESTKLIWALMMIQRPSAWKAKIDNCLPKIIANEMRKPVKRSHS